MDKNLLKTTLSVPSAYGEEEIIDEDEEVGGTTSSGGSMTKWEDLVSPVRGPDNTLDNSPWDVSPVRGPDNQLT